MAGAKGEDDDEPSDAQRTDTPRVKSAA